MADNDQDNKARSDKADQTDKMDEESRHVPSTTALSWVQSFAAQSDKKTSSTGAGSGIKTLNRWAWNNMVLYVVLPTVIVGALIVIAAGVASPAIGESMSRGTVELVNDELFGRVEVAAALMRVELSKMEMAALATADVMRHALTTPRAVPADELASMGPYPLCPGINTYGTINHSWVGSEAYLVQHMPCSGPGGLPANDSDAAICNYPLTDLIDVYVHRTGGKVLDAFYDSIIQRSGATQVYINFDIGLCRMYPSRGMIAPVLLYEALGCAADARTFDFYFVADTAHNPARTAKWTSAYVDPANAGWVTTVAAPVYSASDPDVYEGTAGLDVRLDKLTSIMDNIDVPWGGYLMEIGSDGTILALPPTGFGDWGLSELANYSYNTYVTQTLFKPDDFNIFARKDTVELAQKIRASWSDGIATTTLASGATKIVAWRADPNTGWLTTVMADPDVAYAMRDTQTYYSRIYSVFFVITIVVMAVVISGVVTFAARAMSTKLAKRIGQVDMNIEKISKDVIKGRDTLSPAGHTAGHSSKYETEPLIDSAAAAASPSMPHAAASSSSPNPPGQRDASAIATLGPVAQRTTLMARVAEDSLSFGTLVGGMYASKQPQADAHTQRHEDTKSHTQRQLQPESLVCKMTDITEVNRTLEIVMTLAQMLDDMIHKNGLLISAARKFVPERMLSWANISDVTAVRPGIYNARPLAVAFFDIRGFTTLCDGVDPGHIIEFLNSYTSIVSPIITAYNGTIDKYIGDGILVLFQDSSSAVACALRIKHAVAESEFKIRVKDGGTRVVNVAVGSGIAYGDVCIGTMGDSFRIDVTVIGDVVNTAARLEALTSKTGTSILVSSDVINSLGTGSSVSGTVAGAGTGLFYREIGFILPKGKINALRVCEVISDSDILFAVKTLTLDPVRFGYLSGDDIAHWNGTAVEKIVFGRSDTITDYSAARYKFIALYKRMAFAECLKDIVRVSECDMRYINQTLEAEIVDVTQSRQSSHNAISSASRTISRRRLISAFLFPSASTINPSDLRASVNATLTYFHSFAKIITSAAEHDYSNHALSETIGALSSLQHCPLFDGLLKIYAIKCCEFLRTGVPEYLVATGIPLSFEDK